MLNCLIEAVSVVSDRNPVKVAVLLQYVCINELTFQVKLIVGLYQIMDITDSLCLAETCSLHSQVRVSEHSMLHQSVDSTGVIQYRELEELRTEMLLSHRQMMGQWIGRIAVIG